MRVDLARAITLFDSLPPAQRWPTLSPAYVAADALRDAALEPIFLADESPAGWLMHGVHESRIPDADNARDWQTPYGYGGPLVQGLVGDALARAWQRIDEAPRARNRVAEFVRFHPGLTNDRYYPGALRDDRSVVALDLGASDLLETYSGRARTAIRKAQGRGLRVHHETVAQALQSFPAFYRLRMREIGAAEFYLFSDRHLSALLVMPQARVLSVVDDAGERLSMGLFLFGPAQAEYQLSGTTAAGRSDGATNLLIHAAALSARDAGCTTLYLGGGTSRRSDDPLLRFKTSFAPAGWRFRIGYRIHDPQAYTGLRATHPAHGENANRVLFYRV